MAVVIGCHRLWSNFGMVIVRYHYLEAAPNSSRRWHFGRTCTKSSAIVVLGSWGFPAVGHCCRRISRGNAARVRP